MATDFARFNVFFFVDPQTQRITHRAVDEFVEIDQPAP